MIPYKIICDQDDTTDSQRAHKGLRLSLSTPYKKTKEMHNATGGIDAANETITSQRPAVKVSLCGKNGAGRSMLIDADDWMAVESTLGAQWTTVRIGAAGGKSYVCTGRVDAVRAAGIEGNTLFLSRWLAGRLGKPGRAAFFKNGDALDLRRSNLVFERSAIASVRRLREAVVVEPYTGD